MTDRCPIISGSTEPIFVFFAPNDRDLFIDDLDRFFRFLKGRCHGNQFLQYCYNCRYVIPKAHNLCRHDTNLYEYIMHACVNIK